MKPSNTQLANNKQVGGSHYKKFKIEIWDFIEQNGIPYLEGNAIKYIARWREKGGRDDIKSCWKWPSVKSWGIIWMIYCGR